MRKSVQIGSLGFVSILSFLLESTPIALGAMPLARAAREDAWMAPPIAVCVLLLLLMPLFRMFRTYGPALLEESSRDERMPRRVRLLLVPLILILFFLLVFNTRVFNDLLKMAYLQATPEWVVQACFLAVVVYGTTLGIEVIARSAQFMVGFKLLAMIALPFLSADMIDLRMFTPIFGHGVLPVLGAAWHPFAWFAEGALLALVWPLVAGGRRRVLIYGYLIGLFNFCVPFYMSLFSFGAPLTGRILYPVLTYVQTIAVGEFFERIDPILVGVWSVAMFLKAMIYMYLLVRLLRRVLGGRLQNALLCPIGLLVLLLAPAMTDMLSTYLHTYRYVWPLLAILLLLNLYGIAAGLKRGMRCRQAGDARGAKGVENDGSTGTAALD